MWLTGEIYQQVVGDLDQRVKREQARAFPGDTPQKRTEQRVGLRARTTVMPEDPHGVTTEEAVQVWVTDLSWGGIGFTSGEEIPVGWTVLVHLPRVDGSALLARFAVMHTKAIQVERKWKLYHSGGKLVEVVEASAREALAPLGKNADSLPRQSKAMRELLIAGRAARKRRIG
jgi:hypothetical protein